MPKKTYNQINSVTLAASSSSVTFSSIPQNFRDLICIVSGTTSLVTNTAVRLNADSGSNYSYVVVEGTGTSSTSFSATDTLPEVGRIGTTQSTSIIQIMDYSATDKHKSILGRGGGANDIVKMSATRWANTAAVNSVAVIAIPSPRTFNSGTTLTLYGIEA
jgi:hypothetical protein